MAKTSYLNLTNSILRRIYQTAIADVSAATGHALIITNLINEAQLELYTEANWYSLYTAREFTTTVYTASTISFADTGPDTILDSASGLGNFQAGQEIIVSGSTSNDGVFTIATVAAGTLTLQTSDAVTTEAAGASITLTALTYPVASDFGRSIDLLDRTNNTVLVEDVIRGFDEYDPDQDNTGTPLTYAIQGNQFRFNPPPSSATVIRDRYWKIPTALAANADTSDLPIECENCIRDWAWYNVLQYMNKFEQAAIVRLEFERSLKRAKAANEKIVNKTDVFQSGYSRFGILPPRFPSTYPRTY